MEVQIAVEKIKKYATSESGDTVEIVERPHGGISIVVADGQRSGRSAKAISNIVVRKAISLLAEGVRDGAVARATHDYLHLQRGGKVSAELFLVSIDLVTRSLVISRNARCPVLLITPEGVTWLEEESNAIGIYRNTKPSISERTLSEGMTLCVFTDGVWSAGTHSSRIDLPLLIQAVEDSGNGLPVSAETLADAVLSEALRLENGFPRDDATVLIVKVVARNETDPIRRMSMRFPI